MFRKERLCSLFLTRSLLEGFLAIFSIKTILSFLIENLTCRLDQITPSVSLFYMGQSLLIIK